MDKKRTGVYRAWRAAIFMIAAAIFLLAATSAWSFTVASPTASLSQPHHAAQDSLDCSQIKELGLDKQLNLLATNLLAGCERAPSSLPPASGPSDEAEQLFDPLLGGPDVNVVTGPDTPPGILQSDSVVWGAGNIVLVAYNDTRGIGQTPPNLSGISRSIDGGVTFNRVTVNGHSPFPGTAGSPVLFYSAARSTWYATWLSTPEHQCNGGLAIYSSPNGLDWTLVGCVHSGGTPDGPSGWVDNTFSSPYYGRMYISYNDFARGGGSIYVRYSDNGGTSWTERLVESPFVRNVKMTGSLGTDGTVFIQGLNEGGGGLDGPRRNIIYRSTNGGNTWTAHQQGDTFLGPGRSTCGYFAAMYTTPAPGYWRHMGAGQPGVGSNGVVHYVYADRPSSGGDPGNIKYTRSSDNGTTWSTPIRLNSDTGTRGQWQPSLSVTTIGIVVVSWYDERETTGENGYRLWGLISNDNGLTWQINDPIGDFVSPKPVSAGEGTCYASDREYASANQVNGTGYVTWTDGRVPIGGQPQPDVFFDRTGGICCDTPTLTPTGTPPTRTPTPCPPSTYFYMSGTSTVVPGTEDIGNHCDDCHTIVTLPFPYTVYEQTHTSVRLGSNGYLSFGSVSKGWSPQCLPTPGFLGHAVLPYFDDLMTNTNLTCTPGPCGIYTSVTGLAPNRVFNIEWRTQYYPGNGNANFGVRLFEGQTRFEVVYGSITLGNTSAISGVQTYPTGRFTQYFCWGTGGPATGSVQYYLAGGCAATPSPSAIPTFTPNNTLTPTTPPTLPMPSETVTPASTPTTIEATPSSTPIPATATPLPLTSTPTSCTITFTDVPSEHTFHPFIRCLACQRIVSGYSDGTFRPGNDITRGQISKMVSNAAGFTDPVTGQTYTDVPPTNTFWAWIERLTTHGAITGYPCGGPGEPCDPQDRPYFRPSNNATRGQLSKIVANAANITDPVTGRFYADVPTTHTFYVEIMRLTDRSVMSGYPCGGSGEPCLPPENRPYFRPGNNVTRGQASKIVANTFFPNCVTP